MKPLARTGLEFVYEPSWTALLVRGGAKGALFHTTAPVERLSAIAYGAANWSTRNTTEPPLMAAAPTITPPEPGLGASSLRCQTTCPDLESTAYATTPVETSKTNPL